MTRSPNWAALAVALAALVALAVPAAATAAVTSEVQGSVLTVKSDAEDTITLGVLVKTPTESVLTVNGAETALLADANAEIIVEAGSGADTVEANALAAANYKSLVVNGGEGDDTVTGGAGNDTLNGDAGNDRLIGFKGGDNLLGGVGDDVMVWNNGDGSDVDTGGEGTDEVEVNGSTGTAATAGDSFIYQPNAAVQGGVFFERVNLGKFHIELVAERLTVNALGGDDVAAPGPAGPAGLGALTSLTVNGGTGNDALTGADGADQINGGPGADVLSGGDGVDLIKGGDDGDTLKGENGDDRLVGDRGGDTLAGGNGDDAVVWNNGDGTDTDEGGAGFDSLEVNGAPGAGDAFKLAPNGSAAKFERTNLVPFAVNLAGAEPNGGVEAAAINGGGGDDSFAVSPGLPGMLVSANGEAGNDTLTGAEEADSFFGGAGNDTINPGAGNDLADGQDGNDRLLTRDGSGDLVRGGAGTDSAQTDAVTVDAVSGVEALDATAAADTKALLPTLGKIKVTGKGKKLLAQVPVSCPKAESGGCKVTLTLETAKAVRLGAVHAVVVLGSKSVKLKAGQHATAAVHLAAGTAGLAKGGTLAARVLIVSSDAAGNSATHSQAASLHLPRS